MAVATILIADDATTFREVLATSLRRAGHCAITVGNGEEALAALKADRPDLILLDLAMPRMGGIAFLDAVRTHPQFSDIPILLLTAVTDQVMLAQAAELGAREHLLKSQFSLSGLMRKVAGYLQGDGTA